MINNGREWNDMNNYDNLDVAVRNSYEVIINKKDAIELVGEDEGFFIHLPFEPVNKDILIDKYPNRCFFTPKKMGAQTAEANINAGKAAAHQIINFLEKGDVTFKVN